MKTELIRRFRDVNKNFLPILLETRTHGNGKDSNLATHFDAFLDKIQHSFKGNNELICLVPTFFQLDDITPWRTREFNYLKAYSLADKDTFQQILNTQVTLSRVLNARFSNSVLQHLNSDGWNGRCTVLIRIVNDSDEVTMEYDNEFDLLKYCIGSGALKIIKEYVYSLFPEIPSNFFTVSDKNKLANIITLDFELKNSEKEIRELKSLLKISVQKKDRRPENPIIRSLQETLIEPVLQHTVFLQPGWEMYYSFSNSVHYNKSELSANFESDYGLGGAFLIIDKEISLHDEFDRFIMLVERIVDKIANRVVNYYQIEKITEFARTSGVSAVMSRNMSHNIGSHVLSRLSKKYSGEQNELEPNDLTPEGLARFGQFFSYLMRRMDFLADIATTVPIMTTTSEFVKEIFNPFNDNTFIKKHITGNDLKFDIYPPVTGSNGLYVSIPNDILGKQAIYTIFENVIRNSAKHGTHKRDKFNIDVQCSKDEKYPDHIKFTVFDDSVNRDAEVLAAELNRKIDLPLLNDNNTLRKEAWGMLEMKIAAAYLRKIALTSIDHKKWNATVAHSETPPLLKAAVVNDVHLGYEFYLLRPKEGVIIHPEKRMERINFGKGTEEISSFRDYHELSEFSIIGYNQTKLKPSEISAFETHPGKFTRRFLKNIDNNESHREIETLWKSWLQTIAQNKGIKDIRIVFQSDVEAPVTIEEVSISEKGKSIKAAFVHHPKNRLPEADFVESTTGNSLFSRFKSDDNGYEQLKYYLIEGIIADIVLLDERIQEFAVETTLDESIPITLQQYYEKLGIYIPARETCWLNDPYSNEYHEKAEKWLKKKLPAADFFVVHIGVLEKLLQLSNYPDSEKSVQIEAYVHDLSKFSPDIFNKIIFISGRGRPDTIPAKYRFLNYSNIDQLLEKRICKSTLTGLLYSARSYEEII